MNNNVPIGADKDLRAPWKNEYIEEYELDELEVKNNGTVEATVYLGSHCKVITVDSGDLLDYILKAKGVL